MILEIEDVKVWNAIVFYFCADRAGFWPSAALRHIITESASHHVKRNPAQHRTHASAWEIWIFEVEKLMNPEVFGCFYQFSNFSNFRWFWDALAINWDSLAWFHAQVWFQIDLAWNFHHIQIFLFIWCSCVDLVDKFSPALGISQSWFFHYINLYI